MLDIIALSYNDLPPVVPVRGSIPDEGGTIGRDSENTLVLPDPARLVSRKHGRISLEKDAYVIANISDGNPFFINDQDVPAGASFKLSDGDLLQIGGYVLRIRCAADQALSPATKAVSESRNGGDADAALGEGLPPRSAAASRTQAPLDLMGNSSPSSLPGPFDDLLGTPVAPPKEFLRVPDDRPRVAESAPFQVIPADFDPFSASEQRRESVAAPDPLDANGIALGAVMPKLTPFSVVEGDPDIPDGRSEDSRILDGAEVALISDHETYDPLELFKDRSSSSPLLDTLKGDLSHVPPMELATDLSAAFRAPVGRFPAPGDESNQPVKSEHDMDPGAARAEPNAGMPGVSAPQQATEEPRDETPLAAGPGAEPHSGCQDGGGEASAPPPSIPTTLADGSDVRAELKRAFEEGLRAQLPAQSVEFGPETLRLVGALLRTSIVGTLDLMRARSVVKKEIRVEMTVIEPNDNNPLKFSPDVDIAIQYLFGRKYPGFLGPTDAMDAALSDLSSHQMGMVAGMRSAMEDIIHRFDPVRIQTEVASKGLLTRISRTRSRAEYWDAYCARYQGIADALGNDFQDLYAKAFTRAYEEEIGGHSETKRSP